MSKRNYVELTGNLAKEPSVQDGVTFIRIGIALSKKAREAKEEVSATFVDIAYFGERAKLAEELKTGDFVNLTGSIGTKKDSETGFSVIALTGWTLNKIDKKEVDKIAEELDQAFKLKDGE